MKLLHCFYLFIFIKNSLCGYLFPDGAEHISEHVYIVFTPSLYEAHFHKVNYFEKLHENEHFDNNKPTVIYIPGFLNNGVKDHSVTAIRSAYRERNDHNVIVLDWSYYARYTFYSSLIPQLKIICETVAVNLKKFLDKSKYNVNLIHLVGHSLGAQCIGLVGRHLRSISHGKYEIRRLFGLDPAGPGFEVADWMTLFGGSFDSISSFDGKYVQIIHSNAGALGIKESRGDVDFFPNGGKWHPGCENEIFPHSCFHSRAWHFYQESVRNENAFIAVQCDSFDNFKNGTCEGSQAFMGFVASIDLNGKYFLRTHRNVYKLSLGNDSLQFKLTEICYGEQKPCPMENEFVDRE